MLKNNNTIMKSTLLSTTCFILILISGCVQNAGDTDSEANSYPKNIFEYSDDIEPRWSSFENISGTKGQGGKENYGAKGHPYDVIRSGASVELLNTDGPGIVNRIWITINSRSPHSLRGLVINMYWDGEEKPAVSVPFGDFFGIGLGKTAVFENALFANPEGRSFNSYLQMPFEESAKIEIINQMDFDIAMIFFDVNYQLLDHWNDDLLYFHAFWHRDTSTSLAEDFNILPEISGKGRFLGTNVSVTANPEYKDYWWGEGEIKMYLDGDDSYPTLVGTGTEDYIGTAWGQGRYFNRFNGCSVADPGNHQWSFYRFHIVDPIFFKSKIKVTLQQMGGTSKRNVIEMQETGVDLIPVTINGDDSELIHIYYPDSTIDLSNPELPGDEAWTNFFRSDDVAAVAYFYLNSPVNDLPVIQGLTTRTWNLKESN
jgi:hypothetical protein